MTEYDLDFLKEKGFLETSIDTEDKYDTVEGDVKAVSYRFDPKNRLAYFDDFDKGDIASILKVLREMRNFDYYWFWKEGRIYAFRTFGENKQFIFNTQHSRKTEYIKSKKDKLSKFSSENHTALFDVKDVISLFYRRLWDLRLKLAKAIKGGLDDRERILAAQRLLDRLIFTYFIAEKGIIYGIDKRGRRQEVNARDLFKYLIEVSGDFHSLLNVLFFDYLNDSKKNDMPIKDAEGYSLFIPYLNGGLFRERQITTPAGESIGESEIEIEGFDWKELIDGLNEYNWIIDGYAHAEDEDTIGNLTPEILGHIYEKFVISVSELDDIDVDDLKTTREGELKKGNKKIGAYYTPEVITKYIAENTIFPFVMDKLELGEKYENFIDFHEDNKDDADQLSQFNDALKDIKVLDPAVGSGAFPMAAADILFDWRRKCREKLDDYHLRREIIINNLHGVDIMEGAVEICMLRLWLWLIAAVDTEKEIEALPNIDFNIFEGNSLIGYVDEKEFADLKSKKKPKARWDTLTHKQFTMDNWGEEGIFYLFQQRNDKIREYRNASGGRAERLRLEIKQMTDEFNGLLDSKLLKELQNKGVDIDEFSLVGLKPFHWVMQFSDIFENGGFDVVIGNPPYMTKQLSKSEKNIYKINYYETISDRPNLYNYFINRVSGFMDIDGFFSFITSNSFITDQFSTKLRDFICKTYTVKHIVDFLSRNKVFEGILQGTCIFIFKKAPLHSDLSEYYIKISQTFDSNTLKKSNVISESIPKRKLRENRYNVFLLSPYNKAYEIISKIESTSTILKNVAKIIQSGEMRPADSNCRPYFIKGSLDELKLEKNTYPVVTGKNVNCFVVDISKTRKDPRWYRRPNENEKLLSRDKHSTCPRIVLQRITAREQSRRLYAGLIDKTAIKHHKMVFIENSGLNYILLDEKNYDYKYKPKFLVGILNSILINWYIHHMNVTAALSPSDIKMIPIPIMNVKNTKLMELINNKVDEIETEVNKLQSTEEVLQHIFPTYTKNTIITDIMEEIDDLIFDIYNITPDEKEFVLNNVKVQYEYFNSNRN